MLTGVETAGLVLAAFPVVVQLIQGYQEGCKPIHHWIRFHKTFKILLQGIRHQETRLNDYVRMLLLPLVNFSDEELEALLENPGGKNWQNGELEQALRRRLSNSYNSYMETLERIQELLQEFQRRLGVPKNVETEILRYFDRRNLGSVAELRTSKKIDWGYEWKRIITSWARKELVSILEELEKLNSSLDRLLVDSERLDILDKRRTKRKSTSIQKLRSHANALYNFLAKQWPCNCEPRHDTKVYLAHKPVSRGHDFEISLAFQYDQGWLAWRGPVVCSVNDQRVANTTGSVKKVTFQDPSKKDVAVTAITKHNAQPQGISSLTSNTPDHPLCSLHKHESCSKALGPFWVGENQLTMTPKALNVEISQLANLADLLHSRSLLPRPLRIQLALDIASSFFYSYGTPWYGNSWGKNSIKLALANGQSPLTAQTGIALVERHFPNRFPSQSPSLKDIQEGFIRLSICLEELCFGKPLECMEQYARYYPKE